MYAYIYIYMHILSRSLFRFLELRVNAGRQGPKLAANCQRGISDQQGQSPPHPGLYRPPQQRASLFLKSVSHQVSKGEGPGEEIKPITSEPHTFTSPSPRLPGSPGQPSGYSLKLPDNFWRSLPGPPSSSPRDGRGQPAPPYLCRRGPPKPPRLGRCEMRDPLSSSPHAPPAGTQKPPVFSNFVHCAHACRASRVWRSGHPRSLAPGRTPAYYRLSCAPVTPAPPHLQGRLHLAPRLPPALATRGLVLHVGALPPAPPARDCVPLPKRDPGPRAQLLARPGRSRLLPAGALAEPPKSRRKKEPRKPPPPSAAALPASPRPPAWGYGGGRPRPGPSPGPRPPAAQGAPRTLAARAPESWRRRRCPGPGLGAPRPCRRGPPGAGAGAGRAGP